MPAPRQLGVPARPGLRRGLVLLCMVLGAALAAGASRARDAHQHGLTTLNVALDGGLLALELEGPAANFTGFEHAPRTAADRAAVETTAARLGDPAGLFTPAPDAGCRAVTTELRLPWPKDGDAEADDHHDAGHDHDAPDHRGEAAAPGAGEEHAEVYAYYEFDCAAPAALDHVEAAVIPAFPLTERVEVRIIAPGGQGFVELVGGATRVELPR